VAIFTAHVFLTVSGKFPILVVVVEFLRSDEKIWIRVAGDTGVLFVRFGFLASREGSRGGQQSERQRDYQEGRARSWVTRYTIHLRCIWTSWLAF